MAPNVSHRAIFHGAVCSDGLSGSSGSVRSCGSMIPSRQSPASMPCRARRPKFLGLRLGCLGGWKKAAALETTALRVKPLVRDGIGWLARALVGVGPGADGVDLRALHADLVLPLKQPVVERLQDTLHLRQKILVLAVGRRGAPARRPRVGRREWPRPLREGARSATSRSPRRSSPGSPRIPARGAKKSRISLVALHRRSSRSRAIRRSNSNRQARAPRAGP